MDESKQRPDELEHITTDYESESSRYLRTTPLECSILSEFGWTTTMQQQQQHNIFFHHLNHRNSSIDNNDPFSSSNDGVFATMTPKSETSSGAARGLLLPANMRSLQEEASTSNNNPSSTSSSDQDPVVDKSIASDGQTPPPTSVQISSKKKGPKRIRQQRFAFLTKSEVDHLEDGYRWRKYGQKAVKNSPYPRSYYRCTNTKCNVKKRVERSCEDPTTVITTYEGQHCHQTAGFPRGSGLSIREAAFGMQMGPLNSQFYYPGMHLPQQSPQGSFSPTQLPTSISSDPRDDSRMIICTELPLPPAGSTTQFPPDEGLLGDIVSPRLRNNFHP